MVEKDNMTHYLCELVDVCYDFSCVHHKPHSGGLNDWEVNLCKIPSRCSSQTIILVRCFPCDDKKEEEEKIVYFIKVKKK